MSNLRNSQSNGYKLSVSVDKGTDFHKVIYTPNGTGRDSYVYGNNGGLFSPNSGVQRNLLAGGTASG